MFDVNKWLDIGNKSKFYVRQWAKELPTQRIQLSGNSYTFSYLYYSLFTEVGEDRLFFWLRIDLDDKSEFNDTSDVPLKVLPTPFPRIYYLP
jgi:hypothetical protein